MEEILKTIATPQFWVLVVTVGILINLASAYLKPQIDWAFSAVSLRWATRTEGQRRQRLERIEHLRGNMNEQLLASFSELRAGIWAIIILILSTFTLLFTYITIYMYGISLLTLSIFNFFIFLCVLGIFLALRFVLDFIRIASEIKEARRLEDSHDQANA
jgi:hypothetical protein